MEILTLWLFLIAISVMSWRKLEKDITWDLKDGFCVIYLTGVFWFWILLLGSKLI